MSEVKKFITRYSRDYQGNLQEDPNGSWVLAADAAIRDKKLMDKISALQDRLNAADQHNDELAGLVRDTVKAFNYNPEGSCYNPGIEFVKPWSIRAAASLDLKASEKPQPDFSMIGIERMPPMEYDEP